MKDIKKKAVTLEKVYNNDTYLYSGNAREWHARDVL